MSHLSPWIAVGLSVLETEPVRPQQSQGFAATIIAALVVMAMLALVMMFVSSKPRNRK